MKKATKQTKTTENQPVTSGNLPQGRARNPRNSRGFSSPKILII